MKLLELIKINMKGSIVAATLIALFLVSCKTKKAATAKPVEKKEEKQTVIAVSELYSRSCGTCHDLPEPTKYTSEQWKPILKDMQKRAHLTDKNIEDIYQYLIVQK